MLLAGEQDNGGMTASSGIPSQFSGEFGLTESGSPLARRNAALAGRNSAKFVTVAGFVVTKQGSSAIFYIGAVCGSPLNRALRARLRNTENPLVNPIVRPIANPNYE